MSLKIHLLDAHLECFPENCGAFNDEHTGNASIRRWHPWGSDSKGKTSLDYWLNTAGLFVATPTHMCVNEVTKTEIYLNSQNPNEK